MMINDNHALNPWVFELYDSVKDFAPIGFVGYTPLVFAAHPSVPAKDVKSLIEVAKKDRAASPTVQSASAAPAISLVKCWRARPT